MIAFLRFVGIINAAIWFGAAVFFTFGVGPAFFSRNMVNLVGLPRAGVAVELVLDRYFVLQHWCGVIALAHLLTEWLYTGRPFRKLTVGVLVGLLVVGLVGHYWLEPRLSQLHLVIYGIRSAPEQVEKARHAFDFWHGTAQALNLVMLGALVYYLWRLTHPPEAPRFVRANRFQLE